jgi:DNA-binding transcriptional LysR family regulator
VCRKLGEVAFSLYASKRYLQSKGIPKQGQGFADFDLITFTGAPTAMRPLFMGESLEAARIALRCDNPFVQLRAAASNAGIVEAACFLGDTAPDLVRVWPDKAPTRRVVWLITHQDMRRAARIKAVSTAITETFRRQRKLLEQANAPA